jgi:Flp pilus assembly protein TadG
VTRYALRWLWDRRGQSLVEFALGSIVFFTVLFGIVQFGLAVWQYNTVSSLAQEGARWASVRGSSSTMPATAAQLQTYVESRSPGFAVTVTATPANPSAAGPGTTISVHVSSSFGLATPLIPAASMTLSSTAKMIVSR